MAKGLGQMAHAPLIYVLAQIRFSSVPKMESRWDDFHNRVFAKYPTSQVERIKQFTISDGEPILGERLTRLQLIDKAKTSGLIIEPGMFVFHTTAYEKSSSFFAQLGELLADFIKELPEGVLTSRLGLRYVDLLIPEPDLSVDDQVVEHLRTPSLGEIGEALRADQTMTYKTTTDSLTGTLTIKHRQSKTTDLLPPDLFPNKLKPAPRLELPAPDAGFVGILDYDHFAEVEEDLSASTVTNRLQMLHRFSSDAFQKTTTVEARAKWSGDTHA